MVHPVEHISTAGETKSEPETHWAFSHQNMDPCTPPEFLKMAAPPPTPPYVYVHCAFVPEWTPLYLFTTGTKAPQPRLARLGEKPLYRGCAFAISVTSQHLL